MEDNYSIWARHDRKQERERERHFLDERPVCSCCNEPVKESYYYDINDEVICKECLRINFRRSVADYI